MELGSGQLARISRMTRAAALLIVKAPEVAGEMEDCVSLVRQVCYDEGWREVDTLISDWIVRRRCDIAFATNLHADTMGVLVVAANGDFPVKGLQDAWPHLKMNGAKSAEIVLLAVKREFRGDGANLALIHEVERYSRQHGVTDWYAILDERRLALYRCIGIPFREIPLAEGGGRHLFWGEECFPAHFNRDEAVAFLQTHMPDVWSVVGADLEETT